MKLRLFQSMASIDFSHNSGDIIEVNDREAVKDMSNSCIYTNIDDMHQSRRLEPKLKTSSRSLCPRETP